MNDEAEIEDGEEEELDLSTLDDDELVKPYAFVVLTAGSDGGDAMGDALKAHVKEQLAPYKYPRWFEWRASLPKNDRGKVARRILKEELAACGPAAGHGGTGV